MPPEKHAVIRIERRPLADLKPHPENPRKHPAPGSKEWKTLEASIDHDYFDPIVWNERNEYLVSGHLRVKVLLHLGYTHADVSVVSYDDDTHRARLIAGNASSGKDDADKLDALLSSLREEQVDPVLAMLRAFPASEPKPTDESTPDTRENFALKWGVEPGRIYKLGAHRLACGECRDPQLLAALMDGERAFCINADPPYGMGKEADGVANDNLYADKLDEFQTQWWKACRPFAHDTASAYIWGNAPDLWRWWWRWLHASEVLELRNEIVWNKGDTPGQRSNLMTQYPTATERALFVQFGKQNVGNLNSDQYWEGWDEIRKPLAEMANAAGLTAKRCQQITGVGMFAHWFSKSQWQFIAEKYYDLLRAACPASFTVPYSELSERYQALRGGFSSYTGGMLEGMRSYFDNTHSNMNDVWGFKRVVGEERFSHATPKPVEMARRVLLSSVPEGEIVLCPFAGTAPELIAAEQNNRRYRGVEISPDHCGSILERWHRHTGEKPEVLP